MVLCKYVLKITILVLVIVTENIFKTTKQYIILSFLFYFIVECIKTQFLIGWSYAPLLILWYTGIYMKGMMLIKISAPFLEYDTYILIE